MDGVGFTPESAKRIGDAVKGWEAFQPSLGAGGVQRRDASKIIRVKLDDDISATDPVSGKMQRRKSDFSGWEDTAIEINNIYAIDSDHATAAAGDYIWVINQGNHWCEVQTGGGGCPPANQIWCVPLIGYPTGGTFTISITTSGTFTTSAMAFNIVPADVQTEIESLSGFSGNVSVTGSRFNHVIEFINDLQHTPITLTADGQDLLGYGIHVPQYQIQVGRA